MPDSNEITGILYSVEWLDEETMDEGDERIPGTYVTIRVPDDSRWHSGKVAIRYVEGKDD